jgi:hypothetical protein
MTTAKLCRALLLPFPPCAQVNAEMMRIVAAVDACQFLPLLYQIVSRLQPAPPGAG